MNQHNPPTPDEVRGKLWEKYQQLMAENAVLRGALTGLSQALKIHDAAGFEATIKFIGTTLKEAGNG